jgi:hypothetical protein
MARSSPVQWAAASPEPGSPAGAPGCPNVAVRQANPVHLGGHLQAEAEAEAGAARRARPGDHRPAVVAVAPVRRGGRPRVVVARDDGAGAEAHDLSTVVAGAADWRGCCRGSRESPDCS